MSNDDLKQERLLVEAALSGDSQLVMQCIAAGANPRHDSDFALRMAALFGHMPVVRVLLDANSDLHAHEDQALFHALCGGHKDIADFLIKKGADVDAMRKCYGDSLDRVANAILDAILLKPMEEAADKLAQTLRQISKNKQSPKL